MRRDIEQTRADLGETLDAIGDRVSPGRMIERRKNRMASGMRSLKDRVMGTAEQAQSQIGDMASSGTDTLKQTPRMVRDEARGAPLVAGAIAFGVGFLVAAAAPASQREEEASVMLAEKMQPLKDDLSSAAHEVVEHMKEPAHQALDEVKSTVSDESQRVAAVAQDATRQTADQVRQAQDRV
jgi:ElaB/YqjD/DUF883 family membrane-anchored ribosome-binding protein